MRQRAWAGKAAAVVVGVVLLIVQPGGAWGQGGSGAKPDAAALLEAQRLGGEADRLYGEGRFDAAVPLAGRALLLREKALGPEHPDVALSLNNLAELYRAKGEYDKAEPLYQRALRILEKEL